MLAIKFESDSTSFLERSQNWVGFMCDLPVGFVPRTRGEGQASCRSGLGLAELMHFFASLSGQALTYPGSN